MNTEKCDKCGKLHELWMKVPLKICTVCYDENPEAYEAMKALY